MVDATGQVKRRKADIPIDICMVHASALA